MFLFLPQFFCLRLFVREMDKFGLIGHPIEHSMSPRLFAAAYGGRMPYDLIESADFQQSWDRFLSEYKAINITAPFKQQAFEKADLVSDECLCVSAANIAIKTTRGVEVHNSDCLGVKYLLDEIMRDGDKVVVVGGGGAGRAAAWAVRAKGGDPCILHHDELAQGVSADVVLFALPKAAPGYDKIQCRCLVEANYRDPVCEGLPGVQHYIPGIDWLVAQAITGYELMTGEKPDVQALKKFTL